MFPNCGFRIPDSEFRIPDSGFRMPKPVFRIPKPEFPSSRAPSSRLFYALARYWCGSCSSSRRISILPLKYAPSSMEIPGATRSPTTWPDL